MNTSRAGAGAVLRGAILGRSAGSLPRAQVFARAAQRFSAPVEYPVATEALLRLRRA
jgi:hypothetical protein